MAFASVQTQWRALALADGAIRYVGLDYAGARAGLACARVKVTPELWAGVRTMEAAARAALNGAP